MAQRYRRYAVVGSPHTTVNEAGVFARSDRQLELIENKLQRANGTSTVLLLLRLDDYDGPVPALGTTGLYPADDIATLAFKGRPPVPWRYASTIHADGDPTNLAMGNLSWDGYEDEKREAEAKHLFNSSRYMPQRFGRKLAYRSRYYLADYIDLNNPGGFIPNQEHRNP